MRTVRHQFSKVSLTFTKTGICAVCGGKASRSKVFWQTLNPFNTTDYGSVKTVEQIKIELRNEGTKWKDEYVLVHAKCE